ncbi:PGG domain-containing protein, partial [Cephalotus follicularis]
GFKKIYDMKLMHTYALEVVRCMSKEISALDSNKLLYGVVLYPFFEAAKRGIVEFIVEMIKAKPDFMTVYFMNGKSVILSAVENRQEKIFSLLYGFNERKLRVVFGLDDFRNNLLHLAGLLTPSSQLDHISGAALQMQRELRWYKEVEGIVHPLYKEQLNNNGETPSQVFTRYHKDLVKEGEKWMKDTSTSCTVVGALIITVMFSAAFTVPGGNDQNTGFPIFLHKKYFKVFIISDAISLFASSTSVLMFLGILTSRYAENDFLKSLPTKLIIGLSTLFISIAAMIVAFSAALLIMLEGFSWITIPVILLASVPVTLFVLLQFPLLVEIFMSTYGPRIFDRKMK